MNIQFVPDILLLLVLYIFLRAESLMRYPPFREHAFILYRMAFGLATASGVNGVFWGW